MTPTINIYNEDSLQAMRAMRDKQFDLAIVDPPYGIGFSDIGNTQPVDRKKRPIPKYKAKNWDSEKPSDEYWQQLFRISQNQIVWGGNYFADKLPISRGWIYWDKKQAAFNFSDGELAWTSFDCILRSYCISSKAETHGGRDRIHPTQKPIRLYRWLLQTYAEKNSKIIDTHMGSGSIAIACYDEGYDLEAYEIDKEYYEMACKRLDNHKRQLQLWR